MPPPRKYFTNTEKLEAARMSGKKWYKKYVHFNWPSSNTYLRLVVGMRWNSTPVVVRNSIIKPYWSGLKFRGRVCLKTKSNPKCLKSRMSPLHSASPYNLAPSLGKRRFFLCRLNERNKLSNHSKSTFLNNVSAETFLTNLRANVVSSDSNLSALTEAQEHLTMEHVG